MTRLVERSYISLLLERDPEYYARTRSTNQVEYRIPETGRKFLGHDYYGNYADDVSFQVVFKGDDNPVYYNGSAVVYTVDL
jgi:hypothetical protein